MAKNRDTSHETDPSADPAGTATDAAATTPPPPAPSQDRLNLNTHVMRQVADEIKNQLARLNAADFRTGVGADPRLNVAIAAADQAAKSIAAAAV